MKNVSFAHTDTVSCLQECTIKNCDLCHLSLLITELSRESNHQVTIISQVCYDGKTLINTLEQGTHIHH